MLKKEDNFAYIDGANLHKGSAEFGWELDYHKLRVLIKEKLELRMLISPNNKCSYLLRKQNIPLLYLSSQRKKLEAAAINIKEKAPSADKTAKGSLS